MITDLDPMILTGRTTRHLVEIGEGVWLHRELAAPWQRLAAEAAGQGIQLAIASGFRGFERQLAIWNRKAAGDRPVMDSDGNSLDINRLGDWDRVLAILRWSALPGASRHHWGTDMDIWDRAAVGADYRPALTPDEYRPGGVFGRLGQWLDSREADGFFRPYSLDRGGVAPEPWHLSYGPLAATFEAALDITCLRQVLEASDMALKAVVLGHLEEIYHRFVLPGQSSPAP